MDEADLDTLTVGEINACRRMGRCFDELDLENFVSLVL
jgi:hypothetical protein